MIQEICAGIIPVRHTKDGTWQTLLLLHKKGSYWGFPKGHIEADEDPLAAAIRELKEETGLRVVKLQSAEPITDSFDMERNGVVINKKVFFFVAQVEGTLTFQPNEIEAGQWVPLEQVASVMTFPALWHQIGQLVKDLCQP